MPKFTLWATSLQPLLSDIYITLSVILMCILGLKRTILVVSSQLYSKHKAQSLAHSRYTIKIH